MASASLNGSEDRASGGEQGVKAPHEAESFLSIFIQKGAKS